MVMLGQAPRSTPRSLVNRASPLWANALATGVALSAAAVVILLYLDRLPNGYRPDGPPVPATRNLLPNPPPLTADPSQSSDEAARIAASENAAAKPAPGGPGPEDARPATLVGKLQVTPLHRRGALYGFTLRSNDGATLAEAGFRNGDILTAVEGKPVVALGSDAKLDAILRPPATVAVERDGQTIEWRIGSRGA